MKITKLLMLLAEMLLCLSSADRAGADTFGDGITTFDIDFVSIGNPGNVPDTTGSPSPAGAVPYNYRFGKYEISEQMIDKANALGGLGIARFVIGPDKPAATVKWNEAARFVNWLNTSQGFSPAYKFATQPGDDGYLANQNISLWTSGDAGYNPNNQYRNRLAKYFLPSADEWYKAAYYDPANGIYYDYPTGSDTVPTAVANGTAAGTAVYGGESVADITLAGGLSPYGTMGQGGNLFEWEETDFDLVNDSTSPLRAFRGGNWRLDSNFLLSSNRRDAAAANATELALLFIGFRVVSIPEPSSLALLGVGIVVASGLRRRIQGNGRWRQVPLACQCSC